MELSDADKMMIVLCLFVLLGLSTTQIDALWVRVADFSRRIWDRWIESTGW